MSFILEFCHEGKIGIFLGFIVICNYLDSVTKALHGVFFNTCVGDMLTCSYVNSNFPVTITMPKKGNAFLKFLGPKTFKVLRNVPEPLCRGWWDGIFQSGYDWK